MIKYLLLSLALILPLSIYADTNTSRLHRIINQINTLKTDIKQAKIKKIKLHQRLKKNELAISRLTIKIRETDQEINTQNDSLLKLINHQRALHKNLTAQQQQLAKEIKAAYILKGQKYLKTLLSLQDPSKINRTLTYYHYLNKSRIKLINNLHEMLQQLQADKDSINSHMAKLVTLKERQSLSKQQLNYEQRERKTVLKEINQQLGSQHHKLEDLIDNKNSLQKIIKRLSARTEAISGKPFRKLRHVLYWPTKGRIIEKYDSKIANSQLHHQGVLIAAPEDAKIYAIAPGRVIFANWLQGYGLLMIVDHGDGYMSLYGRNRSLYKKTGETVTQNELIATVGQSGGYQRSALYFAIRHNGTPQNPAIWCKGYR